MSILYRPAAITDLERTCDYLRQTLKNPGAANTLSARVLRSVSLLRENPFMGAPLSAKYDELQTGVRYLIVSKQLVFYEVLEDRIEILRILDGRTDYLAQLFG